MKTAEFKKRLDALEARINVRQVMPNLNVIFIDISPRPCQKDLSLCRSAKTTGINILPCDMCEGKGH